MRKRPIRCSCVNVDGTQCGRRVTDGSNPPICHIHAGRTNSPLTAPLPFDPNDKLMKIAANDQHPQQMQAIKELLRPAGGDCPECASRTTGNGQNDILVDAASDTETAELRSLVGRVNELKAQIRKRLATGIPSLSASPREPLTMPDGRVIYEIAGFLDWCRRRAVPEAEYIGATWEQVIDWNREAHREESTT